MLIIVRIMIITKQILKCIYKLFMHILVTFKYINII